MLRVRSEKRTTCARGLGAILDTPTFNALSLAVKAIVLPQLGIQLCRLIEQDLNHPIARLHPPVRPHYE